MVLMKFYHRTLAGIVAVFTAATALADLPLAAQAAAPLAQKSYVYDGYTVEYDVTEAWGNSKKISVTLTNTGSDPIENWLLYFDPNGEAYGFSGAYPAEATGGITYYENAGYNSTIAPQQSASFTYVVSGAEDAPESFSLCQELLPKQTGYEIALQVYGKWGNQFNGEIEITNTTAKPIYGWELAVKTNFAIQNSWSANITDLGSNEYVLAGTYNSTIPANSSVKIGFIGSCDAEVTPEVNDFMLREITVNPKTLNYITGGYTVEDIEEMNIDSDFPVDIVKNGNGTISSIDGTFTDVYVYDAETALDALYTVRKLLGMKDPKSTLVLNSTFEGNGDEDYTSYFFDQVYDSVPVYGRNVTVVAEDAGRTLSLDSNYYALEDFSVTPAVSADAIAAAYPEFDAELVIFTLNDYQRNPILAYRLTNASGEMIVSAEDETVIWDNTGVTTNVEPTLPDEEPALPDEAYKQSWGYNLRNENGDLRLSSNQKYTEAITDEEIARDVISSRMADLNVNFDAMASPDVLSYTMTQDDHAVSTYHFEQYFKGLRVFGREINVSVEKHFMQHYWLNTNTVVIPGSLSNSTTMEKPDPSAELVVYTWDNEENDAAPQLAYIYDDLAYGVTRIQLEDGTTLTKPLGKGLDEGCFVNSGDDENPDYSYVRGMKLCFFPITAVYNEATDELEGYKLSVRKTDLGIADGGNMVVEMRSTEDNTGKALVNDKTKSWYLTEDPIMSDSTYFYYPEAVATYLNAIAVTKWYALDSGLNRSIYTKSSASWLNINSGDLVVGVNSDYFSDNAYSVPELICDTVRLNHKYTYGASLDVIGHEFTHGVFHDAAGSYNSDIATADGLNEGYADLFGHFIAGNWTNGAQTLGNDAVTDERNMANPLTKKIDFSATKKPMEEHAMIPFINKPAYLLATKYGMPMSDMYQIYYHSLYQAKYSSTSSLNSVRANVLKAAKALGYAPETVKLISDAYDEVWELNENAYTVKISARDSENGNYLTNYEAKLTDSNGNVTYLADGQQVIVNPGWYKLSVSANGYLTYCYSFYMNYRNQAPTINLVRNDSTLLPSVMKVKLTDYINDLPYDGTVIINRLDAYGNENVFGTYQTGNAEVGVAENISVPAGYYTVSVAGSGRLFLKDVITASGKGEALTHTVTDAFINPNYTHSSFTFDVTEQNEYALNHPSEKLRLGTLSISHMVDSATKRSVNHYNFASSPYTTQYGFYCYNSPCTPYKIEFSFNEAQRTILQHMAAEDDNVYSLEVVCIDNQKSSANRTLVFSAQEILSGLTYENGFYRFVVATLSYDISTASFNMTTPN